MINVKVFQKPAILILPFLIVSVVVTCPLWQPCPAAAQEEVNQQNRSTNSQRTGNAGDSTYPPKLHGSEEHVYKTVEGIQLKAWMYRPQSESEKLRPAVVFFFGGGWTNGNPHQFQSHCEYLKSRGVVGITCDYRVASRHGVKAVSCVEDAKSAIRWVRTHAAEFGIDPDRIAAAGGSAGGHIAACTGTLSQYDRKEEDLAISSRPDAMVLFNPALLMAPFEGAKIHDWSAEKFQELQLRLGVPGQTLSPVHNVKAGQPPTLILHGDSDTTVPIATAKVFADAMIKAGNQCELAAFRGAGHGFFNLRGPTSTVGSDALALDNRIQWHRRAILRMDEFLQSLKWIAGPATVAIVDNDNVRVRGHLLNCLHRFQEQKEGHVAFLGGSITEMNGYRPIMETWLTEQFPQTTFNFTNAGIASTCSHTGAFRLDRDVLQKGPVDLLLVEFAVNDDQDAGHSDINCLLGMEGIIRHVRRQNPRSDIVMIHFVNPGMVEQLKAGNEPLSSRQHERLARYYGVSSVYLSREVTDRIFQDKLTWQEYGGTHPGPVGNQLAASLVQKALSAGWSVGAHSEADANGNVAEVLPHPMPESMLQAGSFEDGRLVDHGSLVINSGWTIGIPDWNDIGGSFRSRFANDQSVFADQPGAELSLSFNGNAVGVYVLAGPDAGQLQFQLDDGPWQTVELFHAFSKGLHYPRTVMLQSQLTSGNHRVTVQISDKSHSASTGHAARILSFVVNE